MISNFLVQKISPDTKEKIQLQVVMHDGSAMTFQFSNPSGRAAQQKDREDVKELLQQLLPKFRKKVNSELEEKNRFVKYQCNSCKAVVYGACFFIYIYMAVMGIEIWTIHYLQDDQRFTNLC